MSIDIKDLPGVEIIGPEDARQGREFVQFFLMIAVHDVALLQ